MWSVGFSFLGVGRRAFPFTRGRAATRMRRSKNRLPVLATPTSGHFSRSTQTMALVGGADVAGGQSGERRPRRYHCQSRGCDASRARGRPPSPQTRNTDPNGRHRASPIRKQRRLAGRTDRDLRRQSAAPRHAFAVAVALQKRLGKWPRPFFYETVYRAVTAGRNRRLRPARAPAGRSTGSRANSRPHLPTSTVGAAFPAVRAPKRRRLTRH